MLLKGGNSIFSKLRSLSKNGNPKQEAPRKILLLAVMLTAILPMCAQYDKLTELRRTLTEHYSDDTEKQRATTLDEICNGEGCG